MQKSNDLVTKYSSDEESGKPIQRQKKSTFPRPSLPASSHLPIKKAGNSSKNIYVSPVYINNDSEEEEARAMKNVVLTNSLLRQDSSDDLNSTSTYTKRLLQVI